LAVVLKGARVLALLLCAAVGAGAQAPPPRGGPAGSSTDPAAELVDTLLGALMGPAEITGPELQREVAEVGGIPFRWDVPIAFMGREELAAYLREVMDSEYPPARAEADERLLQALDLLDPATDLRALRGRVLEENVVGFYDERPGRRQLFAVSEEQAFTPMNQIVLVHELRHALQDQYEQLHWQLPEEVGDFDDRRLAWMCLLEGDATLLMERFVLARLGALGLDLPESLAEQAYADMSVPGLADIPNAPAVIRDQLVMPYLAGRDLARAIEARGGADAMKEAWRRPPDSTEQVLHPEKFFRGEPPRVVTPRRAPPGGRLLSQGVLGELLARTLVEETGEAAAGWGGDAWRLWDVEGGTALVWTSAWDSVRDATEFEDALRHRFARRRGAEARRDTWSVFQGAAGWRFAMRRTRDVVQVVSADAPAAFDALLH
jgi:hypothetical protein